jgi:hypothetical protein
MVLYKKIYPVSLLLLWINDTIWMIGRLKIRVVANPVLLVTIKLEGSTMRALSKYTYHLIILYSSS